MENQLARQTSGTQQTSPTSPRLSAAEQVITIWMAQFARNFRVEVPTATMELFMNSLGDLHAPTLNEACQYCLDHSLFMPTIAEIKKSYWAIVEENNHATPQNLNKNPANNCEHCHGDWKVLVKKFIRGKEYTFAVECPNVEQHRSDWASTHPTWHYELPKSLPPKLSEIS